MTDYRITVARSDASEETYDLLGATAEPNFASEMDAGSDLTLEDGTVIVASPEIEAVEVEEL